MEHPCSPNATCEDTTGSYICICNQDWGTVEEATRTEQTRTDMMNVQIILTIVVITLVALTLMKILHASARKDTLVME